MLRFTNAEFEDDTDVISDLSDAQQHTLGALWRKAGEETVAGEVGEYLVSSSHLPSHSDVHQSFFSNLRIQVRIGVQANLA